MFFSYKRKGSEFLIILSCLLTLSCKQQYKELYKFDPEKYTDKVINLSVLADDIIYIPFDSIYHKKDTSFYYKNDSLVGHSVKNK